MTRLTDLQLILLSTASQRDDGSLLPLPDSIGERSPAIDKAVKSLIRRSLAVEYGVADVSRTWRQDGDQRIGVTITDSGRTSLGIESDESPDEEKPSPRKESKASQVLAMLQRRQGATLEEVVAATGWLPHTSRAALTGFRKKGYAIDRRKRGEATCYHLEAGQCA
jgi:hypothetical protein